MDATQALVDVVIAEFHVRAGRWQNVQNASLASIGLSYGGFVTGNLAAAPFLAITVVALLFAVLGVRMQNLARWDMRGSIAAIVGGRSGNAKPLEDA